MTVSLVVPFRAGCPYRERAWSFLRARWEATFPEWQIIVAADGDGPWRKGAAVRRGVELATGQIVAVADADVWLDRADRGVELVRRGAPWVMPFTRVARLNEKFTARVIAGEVDFAYTVRLRTALAERPYPQNAAGGMVILPRETALRIPIDPRFEGWGQEDEAWRDALETLAGPRARVDATLYHLWHPPAPRLNRAVGSKESLALRRAYTRARGKPAIMRELVATAR